MEKKVTASFTETVDEPGRKQKITEILAGGFYEFLKTNGHLKRNHDIDKRIEKIIEDSKRIRHAAPDP